MPSCASTEKKIQSVDKFGLLVPSTGLVKFPLTFLLSHLLYSFVRMFPSMSNCASIKKKKKKKKCRPLSHLHRNYWVDSNETCTLGTLGSPQCLIGQSWGRINSGSTVTLTFVSARFLVSLRTTGCLLNIFLFTTRCCA